MSVKRMSEIREMAIESIQSMEVAGFKPIGRTSEGIVFENETTFEYFVIKPIVKKEGFEAQEAIEEYEEKQEVAREKAEASAKKKEKVKKEKE
jgi:hypothetical protein